MSIGRRTSSVREKTPQEAGLSLVVAASISTSQPQDHRICRQGRACERRDNAGDAERMPGLRHTVLAALRGYRQAVEQPGKPHSVEERALNGFFRIEDMISQQELDSIARSLSAVAGLDVETVNGRPSFVRPTHKAAMVV